MRNVKNKKRCDNNIPTVQINTENILYKTILKTSLDGFWMIDTEGNILEVNNAYQKLTGYSRKELLSMNIADLEVQESPSEIKKHIKLLKEIGSHSFITKHRCKNGKIIDLKVNANSIKHDNITTFAFFHDITELKKQQSLLQKERDIAQKYLDISSVIFVAIDKKGNTTLINKKGCEVLGYPEKEVLNTNWFETFVPERIRKEVKNVFKKIMKGQIESYDYFENPIINGSDKEKLIAWHNTIIKDSNSQIVGTLSSGIDITEQRRAENELSKARKDWENIFQAIGQPSVILDPQRNIIAVNRATVAMTGKSEKDLIGKKCYKIFHQKNTYPKACPFEKILRSGSMETEEMEIETLNGTFLVSCTPVFNNKGILEKIIHIATDITERKKAEKKVLEYQKQLKQMTSDMLLAEERERHRIAAGIHDDIGQRLAIIKFGLDSLQASETRSDILVSLRRQSKLISSAIDEVRSFTFELSNPILYEIGLEAAVETWLSDNIKNKADIQCQFKSTGPKINLNEEKRIILFNGVRELLTNIVKHANASYIEVNIIKTTNNICITVKDNGIGFTYNHINSSKKVKMGFGLINLREKLEFWGGSLIIKKTSPKGTLAKIDIPISTTEENTGGFFHENSNSR